MAHYLVKAKPSESLSKELIEKIQNRAFQSLKPFGRALTYSLEHAKVDLDGNWLWEELDYCSPPLKQEREQVLDRYFSILDIQPVKEHEGWRMIEHYPNAPVGYAKG